MSFILDALKKAERSHPPAPVPELPALAVPPAEPTGRRRASGWLMAVAGGVLALLVVFAGWRMTREKPVVQEARAAVSTAAPAAPAVRQAPQPNQAVEAAGGLARRAEVRPLDGEARAGLPPAPLRPVTRPGSTGAAAGPGTVIYEGSGGGRPAEESDRQAPARIVPGTVVYETLQDEDAVPQGTVRYQRNFDNDTPAVLPAAQPQNEPGGAMTSYENVRLQGGIDDLPDLNMDIHVYSQAPAKRFVFVNMRKYREGETTRNGVLIEEITPAGVTMSFRGTRFTMAPN